MLSVIVHRKRNGYRFYLYGNHKDLLQSPQANISNALGGRIPGLLSVQRSGEPGQDMSTLRIRGVGTFASDAESQNPLIMVDGIEVNNLNDIDPNEVESLSI